MDTLSETWTRCRTGAEKVNIRQTNQNFFFKLKILWKISNKTLIKKQLLLKIFFQIFVSRFINSNLWELKQLTEFLIGRPYGRTMPYKLQYVYLLIFYEKCNSIKKNNILIAIHWQNDEKKAMNFWYIIVIVLGS